MLSTRIKQKLGKLVKVLDLVDDRFGPVKNVAGIKQSQGQPDWWIYHSALTRPVGMHFADFEVDAWGAATEQENALFKCLGETLERYCAFGAVDWNKAKILPASASTFYQKLARCSDNEKCSEYLKSIQPNWEYLQVPVVDIAEQQLDWLPAPYIYLAYKSEGEPLVTRGHTSGTAFHETVEAAVLSGLFEVAERDAISLFWMNQYPANEIVVDIEKCPFRLSDRLRRFRNAGLKVNFFDISTDFRIPTVFTVVQGAEYPYATVAAACGRDCIETISKSLDELMLVRCAQLAGKGDVKIPSFKEFSWVRNLRDHCDLYAMWSSHTAFDFFLRENSTKISLEDFIAQEWWGEPKTLDELREFAQMLKRDLNLSVLYADITLEDVADFGRCVKVVVPEMHPIPVSEAAKWLANERLTEHAERNGLVVNSNPFPHPFP